MVGKFEGAIKTISIVLLFVGLVSMATSCSSSPVDTNGSMSVKDQAFSYYKAIKGGELVLLADVQDAIGVAEYIEQVSDSRSEQVSGSRTRYTWYFGRTFFSIDYDESGDTISSSWRSSY
ncbi:MAG: hypothetical protein JKY43_08440 [Phycisphaerales bacterium]|nr:hypothetical protein [Phycisphaerales bacterium]